MQESTAPKIHKENPDPHSNTLGLSKESLLLGSAVTIEKQTDKHILYLWFENTNTVNYYIAEYRQLVEIRKKNV